MPIAAMLIIDKSRQCKASRAHFTPANFSRATPPQSSSGHPTSTLQSFFRSYTHYYAYASPHTSQPTNAVFTSASSTASVQSPPLRSQEYATAYPEAWEYAAGISTTG